MGKKVHLNKVREFIRSTPVFSSRDIEIKVGNREYALLLLHNLVLKGEVKRIVKGWYTVHDDPVVSVYAFRPAYLGLQEALSLMNLWEQETNVVIITPLRVRQGLRKILDSNIVVHRISSRYFFGFEYLKYGDFTVPVSDIEKTLMDFIYFNEPIDAETLKEMARIMDKRKFNEYLRRYPPIIRQRIQNRFKTAVSS